MQYIVTMNSDDLSKAQQYDTALADDVIAPPSH